MLFRSTNAFLVALSGIVVVFLMLAFLALAITVVSKIIGAMSAKNAPAPVTAAPVAPTAAVPAGGTYTGEVALVDVDEKTAACIMAIVSHETGIPLNELIFKKIKAL